MLYASPISLNSIYRQPFDSSFDSNLDGLCRQQSIHRAGGLLLHIGQYVGVRIQGKPNTAMAEKFTHNFGVDALLQK